MFLLNIDMAKTRAVPLKLLSLPLLELMAADWEMSCKIHSQKLSTGLTAKSVLQTVEKVRSKLATSISNPQIMLCTGPHMTFLLIIWLEDSTQLHFMNSTIYGYTDHIIWPLRTSNIHYWMDKNISLQRELMKDNAFWWH